MRADSATVVPRRFRPELARTAGFSQRSAAQRGGISRAVGENQLMSAGGTTVHTPEPTAADLDRLIEQLQDSWTARITVRRQSVEDTGLRQIYVSLDSERI